MVPNGQKVWTDGRNGRTDDAKTISLRLGQGIKSLPQKICMETIFRTGWDKHMKQDVHTGWNVWSKVVIYDPLLP